MLTDRIFSAGGVSAIGLHGACTTGSNDDKVVLTTWRNFLSTTHDYDDTESAIDEGREKITPLVLLVSAGEYESTIVQKLE